jgi:predicted patatin/cPLA2 family phospholipase
MTTVTSLPNATKGRHQVGSDIYTDGAVLDPLPIKAAIDAGYRDITVIMNNPLPQPTKTYSKLLSRISFPYSGKLARILSGENKDRYSFAKEMIASPPAGVRVKAIYPSYPVIGLVNTQKELLNRAMNHGIEKGLSVYKNTKKSLTDFFLG